MNSSGGGEKSQMKIKSENKYNYIQNKSIIQDVVERVKTINILVKLGLKQNQVIEGLIFHCR